MTGPSGYSRPQIALHWLMAVLIGTNYVVSDGMEDALDAHIGGGAASGLTPAVHVYAGIAVLALVLVRLAMRIAKGAPPVTDATPALLHRIGIWTHRALYALLVLVPALGALTWFGRIDAFGAYHVLAMNAMMILAGVHAAAALFHQFVLKDGLLMRMLRPS